MAIYKNMYGYMAVCTYKNIEKMNTAASSSFSTNRDLLLQPTTNNSCSRPATIQQKQEQNQLHFHVHVTSSSSGRNSLANPHETNCHRRFLPPVPRRPQSASDGDLPVLCTHENEKKNPNEKRRKKRRRGKEEGLSSSSSSSRKFNKNNSIGVPVPLSSLLFLAKTQIVVLLMGIVVQMAQSQSFRNVHQGFPEAWDGDKFQELYCPARNIPKFIGRFFRYSML
jgi:hypothetical protein